MEKLIAKRFHFKLLLALTFMIAGICHGQQASGIDLDAPLRMKAASYRLDSLLNLVSAQSGTKFSYNTNKLSSRSMITIGPGNTTLRKVLGQIQKGTGFNYKVLGAHIIFVEAGPAQNPKPNTTMAKAAEATSIHQGPAKSEKNLAITRNVPAKHTGQPRSADTLSTGKHAIKDSASGHEMTDSKEKRGASSVDSKAESDSSLPADTKASDTATMKQNGIEGSSRSKADTTSGQTSGSKRSSNMAPGNMQLKADTSSGKRSPKTAPVTSQATDRKKKTSASTSSGPTELKTFFRIDGGFEGLGPGAEFRLGNKMTLDVSAGAGGDYFIQSGSLSYTFDPFHVGYYLAISPRYYYNLNSRMNKGKSTRLNAGNYIGFRLKTAFSPIEYMVDPLTAVLMNVHWGMQRPIAKRFLFNSHIGVGYALDSDMLMGTVYPAVELKLAYIFSKL